MGRRLAAIAALACLPLSGCYAVLGAKPGPRQLPLGAIYDDVVALFTDGGSLSPPQSVEARRSRLLWFAWERGRIDSEAMSTALRVGHVVEAHRHWGFMGYDVYLLVWDEPQRLCACWRDHVNGHVSGRNHAVASLRASKETTQRG